MNWYGVGSRLVLAFGVLSLTTLLVASLSFATFEDLSVRLEQLQQQDMQALDAAARMNDMGRIIIATAPAFVAAESNIERDQALEQVLGAIDTMKQIMARFPDYNNYFKNLIAQIGNSLSLLYQNEVTSEKLIFQLNQSLDGLFPLLEQAATELDKLPAQTHKAINYVHFRALLYYQLGLAEKLYNDTSFNELDDTMLRLEDLGQEWWSLWQTSGQVQHYSELDNRLRIILALTSRQGRLFELKNQVLNLSYQEKFLLQNSQQHLHQLAVQIESYTSRVNKYIDSSINEAEDELTYNKNISLLLSIFSLLVAAAISWFYVKKNILLRVSELQNNMRAISSGSLDTQVTIRGRDEVTEMAKDLKIFQQTAKEVEQTNLRLGAEVTERRAAEAQLRATQHELVQAGKLAALGQLSVGITHEINQPLTAVHSHVHSARLWLEKNELEKVKNNLNKISSLLDKTAAITRHIKAFARKSDGKLESVNLVKVVQDALDLLENRISEQACSIVFLPVNEAGVWADPIRLEQVFVNAIGNALDAVESRDNPKITIRIERVGENTRVVVEDNGTGIPEQDLPFIFDPFYTRKTVGKGLGLGLSIAYNIMKDFGGSIVADSTFGQGSQFQLTLKTCTEKVVDGR